MRTLKAAWLALREATSSPTLERTPEPTEDMSGQENVVGFDAQGADQGALVPVYHFNASNIHCLAPQGGTLVDLGCASGRLLAHLARCRPDLTIIGFDLSKSMVEHGNELLSAAGLSPRVRLLEGDMTQFCDQLPQRVDVVSCIFALHHLPTAAMLQQCLGQIGRVRREKGAAVWIFDHVRPKRQDTAESFPEIFTPDASRAFRADSRNSLIASWRFDELRNAITEEIPSGLRSSLARLMPLYQVHWIEGATPPGETAAWHVPDLKPTHRKDANQLSGLFADLPGKRQKN